MEKELGVILFEKEGKGMHLTTQGLYLYEQYQPLLSEFDHIYDALHTKKKQPSRLVFLKVMIFKIYYLSILQQSIKSILN